jgi:hypothetical protein
MFRDPLYETGDPARLLAQLAGRWGQKKIEIVYDKEKCFVLGRLEQPRQNKNLLYWHDKPNKPAKKGPLSFALFKSHSPQLNM